MMGYARKSKAYRLFDETTKKIVFSRNVIFQEAKGQEEEKKSGEEKKEEKEIEMEEIEVSDEAVLRKASDHPTRVRCKPNRYGEWVNLVSQICPTFHMIKQ